MKVENSKSKKSDRKRVESPKLQFGGNVVSEQKAIEELQRTIAAVFSRFEVEVGDWQSLAFKLMWDGGYIKHGLDDGKPGRVVAWSETDKLRLWLRVQGLLAKGSTERAACSTVQGQAEAHARLREDGKPFDAELLFPPSRNFRNIYQPFDRGESGRQLRVLLAAVPPEHWQDALSLAENKLATNSSE